MEWKEAGWGTAYHAILLYAMPFDGSLMGTESWTLDLKAVIDDLKNLGYIAGNLYLTSIQAGFEPITDGEFKTTAYWTAVQNEPDGG